MARKKSVAWATAALATLIALDVWAVQEGEVPPPLSVSPGAQKLRLRVGERQRFQAVAPDGTMVVRWLLDGHVVQATGSTWDFVPIVAQVGNHRLAVSAQGRDRVLHHWWAVRVDPPRPPRIVTATPAPPTLEVGEDQGVELVLRSAPAADGETVRTIWTVDGVPAGEGDSFRLTPTRPGRVRARALATGSLGAAVAREWEIFVRPTQVAAVTPTTTAPPSPPSMTTPSPPSTTAPPPRLVVTTTLPAPARRPTSTTTPLSIARPPVSTSVAPTVAAAVPPSTVPPLVASAPPPSVPAPSPTVTAGDVETLLQRYVAAWRRRDVEELRRIGQVTSDAQAAALRDYFTRVRDLDVEVRLLEATSRGERFTIRFTRQDRFRDAAGRFILKESPPLEKDVVRTPGGLRMVSPSQ